MARVQEIVDLVEHQGRQATERTSVADPRTSGGKP
jgi:hypothetical protein